MNNKEPKHNTRQQLKKAIVIAALNGYISYLQAGHLILDWNLVNV